MDHAAPAPSAPAVTAPLAAARRALDLIAQHDGDVRAWTHVADAAQLCAPDGPEANGALAGVPFGVKDVLNVAGMPTRFGADLPEPPAATYDAACVALLRRAGAVPVGKTVTAEFAFRQPGPTRNPRHLEHTPGGSSSGSAAAVAAGMVPLALGTQTGGSIIRPAAYCGVVGFKPSFGLVSNDGLKLTCESLDTIGWFASTVAGAHDVAHALLALDDHSSARPRRVAVVESSPDMAPDADALHALKTACERLHAQGIVCEPATAFTQADLLARAHQVIMTYEFARNLLPVAQQHGDRLSSAVRETIAAGLAIDPALYRAQRLVQRHWRHRWDALFGDADLILTPSAPGAAPHGLSSTGSSAFNRYWTLLGWPCLHLPTGVTAAGLPTGVQLIARYEDDLRLLRWADWMHSHL